MITTEFVEVLVGGQNYKHYKELGYNPKVRVPFVVPLRHLTLGSNVLVDVQCDYCGKIVKRSYKTTLRQRMRTVDKDACYSCKGEKTRESNLKVYGVENVMNVPEYKNKLDAINLKKYGTVHISRNPEIKARAMESMANKTSAEKKLIREKIEKTNMERYGVTCPLTLPSSRKKLFETLNRGSSQQEFVYKMLLEEFPPHDVFYNESFSNLSLDILLLVDDIKIDIEYDSWYWHLPLRDRRRDEFLKKNGYKVLRIKSGKKVPSKTELLNAISKLRDGNGRKFIKITLPDWDENGYKTKQVRGGSL